MIKGGRILVVGDEYLELIALAAGVDTYLFDDNCKKLLDWLISNIESYDVIVYLDIIADECRDVKDFLEKNIHEKIVLSIEHPTRGVYKDPREYYKEMTRRILGVEVSL